ncbi:pancreas transcription factor 1 subunit alpha [Tetranychus urticae]|uniref:BHLH domain-containing protein n=1 Tax=Tetranychus urticae TaxID=32264 RepID=T1KJ14_TETUR|nr:pancreas transcription factor 1 subunit alpha [Tetranychus urticae]
MLEIPSSCSLFRDNCASHCTSACDHNCGSFCLHETYLGQSNTSNHGLIMETSLSYQSSATPVSTCLPDSTSSEYSTLHSLDDYVNHESTFSSTASPGSSCASSLIESSLDHHHDEDDIQSSASVHYEPSSKSLSSSSSSSSSSSLSSSLMLRRKDEANVHSHRRFRKKRGFHHQIQQRQAANLRERRRMQSINDAFESLRDALPKDPPYEKRSSKVETLKLAIQYIEKLNEYLSTGRNPNDPSQSHQPPQVEKIIIPCQKVFHGLQLAGHSISWTQPEPKRTYVMVAKIWTPEDPRTLEGSKESHTPITPATTSNNLESSSSLITNCYSPMDQPSN